jgi:hypothetical protein
VAIRLCDDRGDEGFSWTVAEPMTRTSHALVDDGRVWLVDPVDWPEALTRASGLGEPQAVVQLLDRHGRDCATIAARLGVPHLVVPASLPETPFEVVPVVRRRTWQEVALWWPATRTLVVAEAIGTNAFFTAGRPGAGVHLLLRLAPPRRQLGSFDPEHLLVGHGVGIHGPEAATGLAEALAGARTGLPRVLAKVPSLALGARRGRT